MSASSSELFRELEAATLSAVDPIAAALAAFGIPGVRVWWAIDDDGYWQPGSILMGVAHDKFDVGFSNRNEMLEYWRINPNATPLFKFLGPQGFTLAYAWVDGKLTSVPRVIRVA